MTRATALILLAQAELPRDLPFEPVPGLEISAAAGDGTDAKPPRFTMTAYTGGVMVPGGFGEPIVVDLTGVQSRSENLPILRDHDRSKVLGHSESVQVSAQRLMVKGVLSGGNQHVDEVVAAARNRFPWGASIGASIQKLEFVEAGQTVKVNGRNFDGPIYVARQVEVYEVTILAIAADPKSNTKVAASAAATQESAMSFAQWLKSKGKVEANLEAGELATLRAEYDRGIADGTIKAEKPAPSSTPPASTPPTPPASTPPAGDSPAGIQAELEERRRLYAAEARRVAKIEELTARHPTIRAQAIEEGWTGERTELEVMRAARPTSVPGAVVRGGQAPAREVFEAALCRSCGLGSIEKAFKPETLQAADDHFRGTMGLGELLIMAAEMSGYAGSARMDLRGTSSMKDVLRHVFEAGRAGIRAGFSNVDVSGILSNVANKFLLDGYMTGEQSWRKVASVRPVKDFKQITSYRLTGDTEYAEVGPTGELTHGTLGEESYTNQAKTFGRILGITRTDIINDDMGAFSLVPRRMGLGARTKLNKVVWTEFMDNSSFFTSGRNNYFEGATSVLSIDSFGTAMALFRNMTDADGNPIAVNPAVLLVPPALEATAWGLMNSIEFRDTTASKKTPNLNPWAKKADPVVSTYLDNSTITGYSSTAWYLLASPDEIPVIEVCFLNGRDAPTIEQAEMATEFLGIQMRGYHDFGAAKQDYRGGVKSKGAA